MAAISELPKTEALNEPGSAPLPARLLIKTMKKPTRELVRTAYHEAGHTVVLYRTTGQPGSHVTIVPHREENWINLGTAFDGISVSLSPEDMEAVILRCYAGGHAQREFDPSCGVE